jgi:hypothetical protein
MPNNILITPGSASIQFSGSAANTIRLQVEPSGSVAFYGNSGSLFGITDSLSGSLMSVNDISGLPILEVFSDDRVVMGTYNQNTLVVSGSRVGIGTASPGTLLDVNGVARATTFTSTQATGTAPFSVSSTTAVSNLNADLLDGYHAASFYLASNPSGYTTNTGTVTSVAGTGTVSGLSLSGTVTTTGNITLGGTLSVAASNFSSQTANTFLAAPNGSAGTPTFRAIAAADVPTLNQNTTGTAANITAYTINQNLGTGNAPSFSGLTSTSTLTIGGKIQRSAAGVGYLDGNYSSIETTNTSGAIYSIGGSYVPGTTSLGNMYGIGYGYSGGTAIGNPGSVPSSVWGMYVASNGTGRIFLDSDNGRGYFASNLYVGGTQVVYNSGTWSISVSGNAATVTDGMYLSGNQNISGAKVFYTPSGQTYNLQSSNIGLTVFNPAAGDAMMTFHVSGDYAGYFGLGGAENDLVWTGWSVGNNRYRIWHSGNDGTGTGLDADLWDGYQFGDYLNQAVKSTSAPTFDSVNIYDTTAKVYKSGGRLTIRSETTDDVANFASYGLYLPKSGQTAGLYAESPIEARSGIRLGSGATNGTIDYGATTTNTANRLVLRDANGDINSRYANSSYVNTSDDVSTGTVTYIMAKFGDNYYRSATAAKVASFISGQTMNISGTSTNITAHTINQSVGTGNSPSFASLTVGSGVGAGDANIEIGTGRSASGFAYIDLVGDTTYSDYGLRIVRTNGGANATSQIYHRGTGNLEIFTSEAAAILFATSGGERGKFASTGTFIVGTGVANGAAGEIRATDNITAYYSSDKRLKENIIPLSNALNKISRINGVEFDWTQEYIDTHGGEDGYFVRRRDVGIIAQEIKEVLPEVVAEKIDGYLAVRYEKIVPLLIEAIKELTAKVQLLENK